MRKKSVGARPRNEESPAPVGNRDEGKVSSQQANLSPDNTPASPPKATDVRLESITIDPELQSRAALNVGTLREYEEITREGLEDGQPWPFDAVRKVGNFLVDGFHRCEVAKRIGLKTIPVEHVDGTRLDAIRSAVAANRRHGLQRSPADKRRAAEMALTSFPDLSDREISRLTGVSHTTINRMRSARVEHVPRAEGYPGFHDYYSREFIADIESMKPREGMFQLVDLGDEPCDCTFIARTDDNFIFGRAVKTYEHNYMAGGAEAAGDAVCWKLLDIDCELGVEVEYIDPHVTTPFVFEDWAFDEAMKIYEYTRFDLVNGELVFRRSFEEVFGDCTPAA